MGLSETAVRINTEAGISVLAIDPILTGNVLIRANAAECATTPTYTLPAGMALGKIDTGETDANLWTPYNSGATDGSQFARAILLERICLYDGSDTGTRVNKEAVALLVGAVAVGAITKYGTATTAPLAIDAAGKAHLAGQVMKDFVDGDTATTDIPVAGIKSGDYIVSCLHHTTGGATVDRTAECSATSDGNIQMSTTDTSSDFLEVVWLPTIRPNILFVPASGNY